MPSRNKRELEMSVAMADTTAQSFDSRAPSPSPPPPPPTAASPGPRANALEKIFHDALAHTLRSCSYSSFAACFPTLANYVPEALTGLHNDFVTKLDEMCKVSAARVGMTTPALDADSCCAQSEFEALLDERSVIGSLNDLDTHIVEARLLKERAEAISLNSGQAAVHSKP